MFEIRHVFLKKLLAPGTRLGIRPNTKVEIVAEDDKPVLYPVSPSRLKGIGREIADGTDAAACVRKLRQEWEKRR